MGEDFTRDELVWIANAAGLDTGTSNIRPREGDGLSGQGLLALQNKLRARLGMNVKETA